MTEPAEPPPTFAELVAASFRIGVLGFGGPAGQIALMHRVFVDEKGWLDEARYLHALSYCTLLPGPEAQQLATYVGWTLHGVRGGVAAGLLFVLPGLAVMLGLCFLYATQGQTPAVGALFFGVKCAVAALVADAVVRIGRRALKTRQDAAVATAAFLALAVLGAPFPVVVIAAGLLGWMRAAPEPAGPPGALRPRTASTALAWLGIWLAPPLASLILLGPGHLLSRVGGLFSGLALVSFGGAYAALAYLQQQAVAGLHWLSAAQMIDGLGLAETTPGPLVLVNAFVAFMAGWQAPGGGAVLAVGAALMAAWCTFAPSFVWIFAGAPYAEGLRGSVRTRAALSAVTAAVLGVIANLGIWFAVHTLFSRTAVLRLPWGHGLEAPDLTSLNPWAAALSLAAGLALIRWKAPVLAVVLACAAAGLAIRFWGPGS